MKRLVWLLPLLLLMPLSLSAHPGHGLAVGHEWFHAMYPLVGALLVVLVWPTCQRAWMKVRKFTRR